MDTYCTVFLKCVAIFQDKIPTKSDSGFMVIVVLLHDAPGPQLLQQQNHDYNTGTRIVASQMLIDFIFQLHEMNSVSED